MSGQDDVALVLAVLVVDDDDGASLFERLEGAGNGSEADGPLLSWRGEPCLTSALCDPWRQEIG